MSFRTLSAALIIIVVIGVSSVHADVRRAPRWRGLLACYQEKPPIPRCINHHTYTIPGGRRVGEVTMDGRLLFQIIARAGGFRVEQRAEIVTRRLHWLLENKKALSPVRVENWDGHWVVTLDGELVVTAATGSSLRYNISRRELANRWADTLRTAINNALGPGHETLKGYPPVEKLHVDPPMWDDRYHAMIKGDRAFGRKEYDEAIKWYEVAVREDPSSFDAYYCLGRTYGRLRRLEQAERSLVACLQLRPNYEPARRALAIVDRHLAKRATKARAEG